MVYLELAVLCAVVLFLLYKWGTQGYDTFAKRGIAYDAPYPFVGNTGQVLAGRRSLYTDILEAYNRHKQQKICGYFNMSVPIFVINEPQYIKKICIKDFEYFPHHRPFLRTQSDQMVNNMLTILQGQRWKDMRATLTPVFTAAKMRAMFTLMNECFEESLKYLHEQPLTDNGFDIELKQCCTRLSNDIIASTAFGLKINSYQQLDNEFYKVGQAITNFRGKQLIKFLMSTSFPQLMNLINIKLFDSSILNYFMNLVVNAMKYRQEHNIYRADMIQLLMEARADSNHQWSSEELVAQCFVFFFAAFENNANLICTTCHELLQNPAVQARLYEEAASMRAELNGAPLDYDAVNKMKYMDMVVSESLRKWSLTPFTDRVCAKDYQLCDDDGNLVFEFKKGDTLWLPIYPLQMDAQYFPNPNKFDPERFSDEQKQNIQPFTYLPFGVGPRSCIGNRYALMQAKAMLYYLVLNFQMEPSVKTVKDLLADMRGFQITPISGFWIRFVPRK